MQYTQLIKRWSRLASVYELPKRNKFDPGIGAIESAL
jgi:hypothetical protein